MPISTCVSAIAELTPDGHRASSSPSRSTRASATTSARSRSNSRLRDLEPEQLRALLKTETGDIYNADQVEDSIIALTEEIGKLGYAFVEVEPDPAPSDEAERIIDLTYVINEGPRVYVERIDIIGNVRTLDEVIRREFRLVEGDAFNTALLRRSRQRIQNLGFFEKVEMNTAAGLEPRQDHDRGRGQRAVDRRAVVRRRLLDLGRPARRHPPERAQSARARPVGDAPTFTISGRTQQIDLSFTEPYFLDRDLAAGVRPVPADDRFPERGLVRPEVDRRHLARLLSADRATGATACASRCAQDEINDVDDDASMLHPGRGRQRR